MSYVNSADFYHNYTPVAHRDEKLAPVPGWGMRATYLAGPSRIGVGGFGQAATLPANINPMLIAGTIVASLFVLAWWSSKH